MGSMPILHAINEDTFQGQRLGNRETKDFGCTSFTMLRHGTMGLYQTDPFRTRADLGTGRACQVART
jgi:hypothetical protein